MDRTQPNWTWQFAMDRAERLARRYGRRYRVTGRRHTFPLGSVLWIYHVERAR